MTQVLGEILNGTAQFSKHGPTYKFFRLTIVHEETRLAKLFPSKVISHKYHLVGQDTDSKQGTLAERFQFLALGSRHRLPLCNHSDIKPEVDQ